jgi:hypothetical protein
MIKMTRLEFVIDNILHVIRFHRILAVLFSPHCFLRALCSDSYLVGPTGGWVGGGIVSEPRGDRAAASMLDTTIWNRMVIDMVTTTPSPSSSSLLPSLLSMNSTSNNDSSMVAEEGDTLLINVPNSTVFLGVFISPFALIWILAVVQLIFDYQLFHTTRVRPPFLKVYIHWWSLIISSLVIGAYLSLSLARQPFVWRLCMNQANCVALEIVIYWVWAVFGVARRTAGQMPLPSCWQHIIYIFCILCHAVSLWNAQSKQDSFQLYVMTIMAFTSWATTSIGYIKLKQQVQLVLSAHKRSYMRVDPTPIKLALQRVFLLVTLQANVFVSSVMITLMDAFLVNKRVVPILLAIAWVSATGGMAAFGWVSLPLHIPMCMLRWCCPGPCVKWLQHSANDTATLMRYRAVRIATSPVAAASPFASGTHQSSGHRQLTLQPSQAQQTREHEQHQLHSSVRHTRYNDHHPSASYSTPRRQRQHSNGGGTINLVSRFCFTRSIFIAVNLTQLAVRA